MLTTTTTPRSKIWINSGLWTMMLVSSSLMINHLAEAAMGDYYSEKYDAKIWNYNTHKYENLSNEWCLEQKKMNCCTYDNDCQLCWVWPEVTLSNDGDIKLFRQGQSSRNKKRCGQRKF